MSEPSIIERLRFFAVLVIASSIIGVAIAGQDKPTSTREERVAEWLNRPKEALRVKQYKNLEVLIADKGLSQADLSSVAVQSKIEQRFREAGIRVGRLGQFEADGYAYINIDVYNSAFRIDLNFTRPATITLPDGKTATISANVWEVGSTGVHRSQKEPILSSLDNVLNEFIPEYLKANEPTAPAK